MDGQKTNQMSGMKTPTQPKDESGYRPSDTCQTNYSNSHPRLEQLINDDEDPKTEGCNRQETEEEDRSHTFRKRRLTCSRLQLMASVQLLEDLEDDINSNDEDKNGGEDENADKKAGNAMITGFDGNDPKSSFLEEGTEAEETKVTQPANEIKRKQLESRVLHASIPPTPTEPKRKASHLYRHPPHPLSNAHLSSQPSSPTSEWKRSRKYSKDDTGACTLPFPRHVVGTYSCHGVEPIYDQESAGEYGASTAKINQDRGGVAFPYANCPRTALFAAYDGHGFGGELVAQYALHEVPKRLERHKEFESNVDQALIDVFVGVDEDLGKEEEIDPVLSGCTACVVLVKGDHFVMANAGDSRAVMAVATADKCSFKASDLTVDQNPDSPGEQERIEGMGGYVSQPPEEGLSARVWLDSNHSQIGLAMSRSLGDHAVKSVGVIAKPVVSRHQLQPNDEFMIIATDGVWEFLTSQEAVDIVARDLYASSNGKSSSADKIDRDLQITGDASIACQHLIEAAAAKWHEHEGDYRDDITALVVKVKDLWHGDTKITGIQGNKDASTIDNGGSKR